VSRSSNQVRRTDVIQPRQSPAVCQHRKAHVPIHRGANTGASCIAEVPAPRGRAPFDGPCRPSSSSSPRAQSSRKLVVRRLIEAPSTWLPLASQSTLRISTSQTSAGHPPPGRDQR